MTYFDDLVRAKNRVGRVLAKKGIEPRYLKFGGPGDQPKRAPTVPTDARSEFLANRAMGDWAEKTLAAAMRASSSEWQVTHYGNTEMKAAGDPGFKAFYLEVLEEVRNYGKRPDLLIFPKKENAPENISTQPFATADKLARRATAALEVRSSKFEALKYMEVRRKDKEKGVAGREAPSFTVKVEDLKVVYRWIERNRMPQAYAQVFFDSVFAINVLQIFQIIGSGKGFSIESPARSQEKATIMIPITSGEQIGTFNTLPTSTLAEHVTRLFRHDAYVVPVGGELELDIERLIALLIE